MSDRRSFIALDWVNEEIAETLRQALEALDGFVSNVNDITRLRFCLTYVYQVSGSLRMIELDGAAKLAKEVETLLGKVLENPLAQEQQLELAALVRRALESLAAYVARVSETHADAPEALLDMLNEVRAANEEEAFSASDVFNPDISAAEKADKQEPAIAADEFNELIRRLRQGFQKGMIGIVRDQQVSANLDLMNKVCAALYKVSRNTASEPLWKIAVAITQHLHQAGETLDLESKKALKQIDTQLKHLEEKGRNVLAEKVDNSLLKSLLYIVATAEPVTDLIRELRETYQLDAALKRNNEETERAFKTFAAVVATVIADASQLEAALPTLHPQVLQYGLQRLANTLALLGLQAQSAFMAEFASSTAEQGVTDTQALAVELQTLQATLQQLVEARDASTLASAGGFVERYQALIASSREGLEAVKEQIVEFVATQWDPANIQGLPALIAAQKDQLNLSPFTQLLPVMASCQQYIVEQLLTADAAPEWSILESLADAISSVEYYLECVISDSEANLATIVSVARESVEALGYAAGEWLSPPTAAIEIPTLPVADAVIEDETVEESLNLHSDDIDEDILEIFIEEAGEVLEHINEYLPQLQADFSNQAALGEVRRSYHTLKGSGRMVGAEAIGDFAWSVERMLNRVMDGGAALTANAIAIVAEATAQIPMLLSGFENKTPVDGAILKAIISKADAEWEGKAGVAEPVADDGGEVLELADIGETAGDEIALADLPVVELEETPEYESEPEITVDEAPVVEPAGTAEVVKLLNDDIDEDILEIFIEEAGEVLEHINEYLPQLQADFSNQAALGEVRRSYHTLKGSGRMVGAEAIGDFAWSVERMLNRVMDGGAALTANAIAIVAEATAQIPMLLSGFENKTPVDGAILKAIISKADAEWEGRGVEAESEMAEAEKTAAQLEIDDAAGPGDELLEIFISEAETHIGALAAFLADIDPGYEDVEINPELQRALHTLKGSAYMAGINRMAELVTPLEGFVKDLANFHVRADGEILAILMRANDLLQQQLAALRHGNIGDVNGVDELIEEVGYLHAARIEQQEEAAEESNGLADKYTALLSEALECLTRSEGLLNSWKSAQLNTEERNALLNSVERLAETAREASYPEVADLAQALAGYYRRAIENGFAGDEDFFALAMSAHDELDDMMDIIAASQVVDAADAVIAALNEAEFASPLPLMDEVVAEFVDTAEPAGTLVEEMSLSAEQLDTFRQQLAAADEDTLEIFLEEAGELLEAIESAVHEWLMDRESGAHPAEVKRVLHTLKGGARLAELSVLGDLTHNYESMIESAEYKNAFDDAFFNRVQAYQNQLVQLLEMAISPEQEEAPALNDVLIGVAPAAVEPELEAMPIMEAVVPPEAAAGADDAHLFAQLAEQYQQADADTLEIFLEEVSELAEALDAASAAWLAERSNASHASEMKRVLHTLKGGARLAELSVLGDITHNYESMIEAAEVRSAFDDAFFARLQAYQDQAQRLVDFILNGARLEEPPVSVAPVITTGLVEEPVMAAAELEAVPQLVLREDQDAELVALFIEEAKELSEGIEECIANFLRDRNDREPLEELKRLLHTLKGGARLAGITEMGDLSHDFETFIINKEREGQLNDENFIDEMQGFHDQLNKQLAALQGLKLAEPVAVSNVVPIRPDVSTAAPAGLVSQAAIDATRNFIENFNKESKRGNREPVKIAQELLESLINLAGESSIGRSRIEESISELGFSVEEMDMTIDRLHGQIRRLEIETEAQIIFRQEQVGVDGQDNFDPLEMDRYSSMQQLSKSLMEAASDLDDITSTLSAKMRDMETLVGQQARINTDLQEGLMRAQMVPFSRMVPRLRRIVRQVAGELGKKVEFSVENAEGEMDRTILERMVAPLEHMLRNAVDHGIEMPDARRDSGKDETGSIVLSLSREGGEVVLTLQDNGAGIRLDAVRKKAKERGLLKSGTQISDHEVLQFILHAGFSTAEKVTQISGRGVGMDVVHSEIKQMGGTVEIYSREGEGTRFVVRLPFTVSVNRALMVCIGSDTYAIPLNTIEGIVRVSPYELEAYYQPDAPLFEYAGQSYSLRYMGSLLQRGTLANLEGITSPLPVVLIRSSDYSVAVQVDRLLGSQEVVVKSLGPQFGMVEGLSGATVLGDGSVVVILDMLALIRADANRVVSDEDEDLIEQRADHEDEITRVMVVDDSVTVRKVTSRLLERYGLEVILAKDGLDAITQLQEMEKLPHVMLLDIEMPRMDGFEVVSRVRHSNRLQNIPICMITSRTGEKHRERALSLGATKYLGKPFQERELLLTIGELTGAQVLEA